MVKRILIAIMLTVLTLVPGTNAIADEHDADPTVFVRQDAAVGSYLTDPNGMTLYLFANDTGSNESTCPEDCAAVWPPMTAEEPLKLPLLVSGELSLFDREDGSQQLAYNGIPLYYYTGDEQAGDLNGHGFRDRWYVVAPGAEIGADASAMATPAPMDLGTPAAAGDIEVVLGDYHITANASTLKVGQEYTFQLTNEGIMIHEFVVEKAGAADEPLEIDGIVMEVEDIDPGATASLTITFTEPGSYQISCWVEGHYPAGMVFNLKVVD